MRTIMLAVSMLAVGCGRSAESEELEAARTTEAQQALRDCSPASYLCDATGEIGGCGCTTSCGAKLAACKGMFCLYNDHGLSCSTPR